jgi:hypothetical protein
MKASNLARDFRLGVTKLFFFKYLVEMLGCYLHSNYDFFLPFET